MPPVTRAYQLGARAEAADARKERVLRAAYELALALPLEQVTLAAVAERAEVSLKTVVRAFGTKDELLVEAARWSARQEHAQRHVSAGDVTGAVRMLAERYEILSDRFLKRIVMEQTIPAARELGHLARAGHFAWLAEVFARWLPARASRMRTRRLMALFGATEIYVWTSWRRDLGLSAGEAELTMRETIEALLEKFERADRNTKNGGERR